MQPEFWHDGLSFSCQRCSHCCRHEPGFVFLSASDLRRLLLGTGLSFRDFKARYTKPVDIGTGWCLSLTEKRNNDCILWEKGCTVYEHRPVQCSTYPFWSAILEDGRAWNDEAADCPGINKGQPVSADAIAGKLLARRENPALVLPYSLSWETMDENSLLGRQGLDTDPAHAGQAQEQDIVDSPEDRPGGP